jgi:hypothetical protein
VLLARRAETVCVVGYGSGGPHITPERSMQQLVWSEKEVQGGQRVDVVLEQAQVKKNVSAWLRPGAEISPQVREMLERNDSYRDVAVQAIPLARTRQAALPDSRTEL